jgi:mannose-6-phosphate isomerase class I/oxalate decarboxylase/phosphoglucose isomerase-like protein (cupin superfamily)
MCVDKDEEVLVVSTDHLVGEGDYNGTIVRAKELLRNDNIVVVGCHADESICREEDLFMEGHSAFVYEGSRVTAFVKNAEGMLQKNMLLDSGIFLMKAGTYLRAIEENEPQLYDMCQKGNGRIRLDGDAYVITGQWLASIPSLSVGESVFQKWAGNHVDIVEGTFVWSRLLNQEVLTRLEAPSLQGPAITWQCTDVSVLNEDKNKLVVANSCQDLLIVNTKDATLISKKGDSAAIREIIKENYEKQQDIFDEGDIFYTTWGIKETLNRAEGYMVKKLTIFPGKYLTMHKHEQRSEHWSIVSGTASITMYGKTKDYERNNSVFVPVGTFHKIENRTAMDLIVIEVSVGLSAGDKNGDILPEYDDFVKLQPVYKDYLWGGHRLRDIFGKGEGLNPHTKIAESWEVSAHKAGVCGVVSGNRKGMLFSDYLDWIGKNALGWKCQPFEKFPLLIKFIDATNALSVQVHPDDAYAMSVEGDYGKNEMWYILDAEPDASLYLGFQKEITKEECMKRIAEGTLTEVLNKVPVKKGDVIFVKAGTVHAILEGLLILEIQQSSNATYRLYDYDRTEEDGSKRPLHLEKALDNLDFKTYAYDSAPAGEREMKNGYSQQLLGECKYFSATLIESEKEEIEISLDEASFSALVFLQGKGIIQIGEQENNFAAGDSFFVPAGKKTMKITGKCQFVISRV